MRISTAKEAVINRLLNAYENALYFLCDIMYTYSFSRLRLKYEDTADGQRACYNMNDFDGTTDRIEEIRYTPPSPKNFSASRFNGEMVVIGESGQEYPLDIGYGIDSQDSYTLVGLYNLVRAAAEEAQRILSLTIKMPKKYSKKKFIETLKTAIGEDGHLYFEHGYPYPPFHGNGREVIDTLVSVHSDHIMLKNAPRAEEFPLKYTDMDMSELVYLINEINKYIIFVQTQA